MRDVSVMKFTNKIIGTLAESDPSIKDVLDELKAEAIKERIVFLISAGATAFVQIGSVMLGGAGIAGSTAMQCQAFRGMIEAKNNFGKMDKLIQKLCGGDSIIGFEASDVYA
jgi:hypothetical protein